MKKTNVILPIFLLIISVAPITSFAAVSYTTEVTNTISLGDVNVSINEYEYDSNGNEIAYNDFKTVLPGDRVDKIIRIRNDANAVWIRAKLTYESNEGCTTGLSDEDVELASDKWVRRGDYYYYPEPVESKTSVDFVKAVNIPIEWNSSKSGDTFRMFTNVEAVQKANFTPDFSSDDPWFGTVIEECVHTPNNSQKDVSDQLFQVVFENGSDGLVKVGDDFFSNWPFLMPGDVVSNAVTVGNHYNNDGGVNIYFRTETLADDALLSKVHLTIKNDDDILYDGSMNGRVAENVSLGCFKKGETRSLTYTLSIPAELTNEYALASTKTKWIFSCTYGDSNSGSFSDGSHNSGWIRSSSSSAGPGVTNTSNTDTTNITNSTTERENSIGDIQATIQKAVKSAQRMIPKMGDTNLVQVLFGASAGFLFIAGILGKPHKKRRKEKIDENKKL